eukprot:2713001-Rhodomonas_salina.1
MKGGASYRTARRRLGGERMFAGLHRRPPCSTRRRRDEGPMLGGLAFLLNQANNDRRHSC